MSSKIGKRQQKRARHDASGAVKTCPAFRRTLQALPESVDFPKSPDPSRLSDSEDAAAAFKARALAFASARSTADELGAMGGVIAALASLAAGERETPRSLSRVETLDEGKKTTKITRETVAPKTAAVNRAIDQDATRVPIEPAFGRCLACMLDVLFLPNSRPLHRAVLAAPRAFPPRARIRAEKALVSALRDRIAGARSAEASTEASGAARLRVLGVLFSVASCQPQTAVERRVVRAVAVDAAALIGEGVLAMIQEAETGRRVPPAEMETCQEAVSVAYALLQRHPGTFLGGAFSRDEENHDEDDEDDEDDEETDATDDVHAEKALAASSRAARSLIASLYRVLQGSALSREAAVSAGVTVAAAVGAGVADPKRHAAALADAFVGTRDGEKTSSVNTWCRANGVEPAPTESLALAFSGKKKRFGDESGFGDEVRPGDGDNDAPTTFARLSRTMTPFGRLCAARGVLTAASAEALAHPLEVPEDARGETAASPRSRSNERWTLLTSHLFPFICASLERPEDSHHKYHAAAALRAALVRVKALARNKKATKSEAPPDGDAPGVDDAFPTATRDRVCDILWANWEDPLAQTAKETLLSFETLLDVEEARAGEQKRRFETFLEDAASSLLRKDASCKGRYVPLAAVARRLGARRLLTLAPELLTATLRAMRDDSVCTAAGALAAAVSQSLLWEETARLDARAASSTPDSANDAARTARGDEKKKTESAPGFGSETKTLRRAGKDEAVVAAEGSAAALVSWRAWWVGPLAEALLSPGRERAGAGTYALPAFLKQDGASVVPLLVRIQEVHPPGGGFTTANDDVSEDTTRANDGTRNASLVAGAVVAVLRAARQLGLLDPDDPSRVSRRVAAAAARTFVWRSADGHGGGRATTNAETSADRAERPLAPSYGVDATILLAAATRRDARSRRDALDFLCADGKRSSLPGALERRVLRRALPTLLRDPDPAFRSALVSATTRLLVRIKAGCVRAATFARARPELVAAVFGETDASGFGFGETFHPKTANPEPPSGKAANDAPSARVGDDDDESPEKRVTPTRGARCFGAHAKGVRAVDDDEAARLIGNASACVSFIEWFTRTLVRSAYPGAPYERKQTALDLLLAVAETFPPDADADADPDGTRTSETSRASLLASRLESSPYATFCLGPDVVTCLLGAAVDSWDRLRAGAFRLLSKHPAPLAGIRRSEDVAAHFKWALALSRSPRVRESDAAALLLRLLFRKYAVDGGWTVTLTPEVAVVAPPPREEKETSVSPAKNGTAARSGGGGERRTRTAKLLGTMCDLIEHECEKAERDLLAACRQSLAHGALLATRYALEEIDFSFSDDGDDEKPDGDDEKQTRVSPRLLVKASSARLLRLMERVTAVALRSISAPDGANVGAAAADIAPDRRGGGSGQGEAAARAAALATFSGVGGTTAGDDAPFSASDDALDDADGSGSDGDASEERSLAPRAQVIVTACWLTMKEVSLVVGELARRVDVSDLRDDGVLDPAQLRDAGDRLLTTLLTLKHNGAIEKTLVGLTCLGERLLRSPDARLSALPREWLARLFARTTEPEQNVHDLIRRSAGIPFGFMAVFLAEPRGVPRALLHEALEKLLDLANDDGDHVRRGEVARGQSQGVHVPQVHAFNVMRAAFADRELSTETVGFAARGLTAAIKGFSSPHWEVRNGATLAFAALLTKVVGYMNAATPAAGGASRRAVAGDEFFRRFPETHPFLLAKLAEAADALESKTDGAVHPALYPILALLSRLRPSAGAPARETAREKKEKGGAEPLGAELGAELELDPAAFAPSVRRCARGRVHAVRAAAARALAPLIKAEDVAGALAETFRDTESPSSLSSLSPARTGPKPRRPRLGYNAAHGALLCASELLKPEGPAEAGDVSHAMAAVEAAAEGLARCSYLVDPEASPVAAAAAAWALCAHETLRLARHVRDARLADSYRVVVSTERTSRFFAASRRLTRLARAACDVPSSARGFAAGSGGGDAALRAAAAGVSVAPGDVEWFKRAARLRCVAALDTQGFAGGGRKERAEEASDASDDETDEDETENDDEMDEDETASDDETDDEFLRARSSSTRTAKGKAQRTALRAILSTLRPSTPYESRASALRALRDAGASAAMTALGPARFAALRRYVAETLLPRETRHACARRALEVLELWINVPDERAIDEASVDEAPAPASREKKKEASSLELSPRELEALRRVVEKRAGAETNERVRCAATRALGKLAGARLASLRKTHRGDAADENAAASLDEDVPSAARDGALQCAAQCASLVALVKAGSAPERPLDVRRAAARALAHSGLLREFPNRANRANPAFTGTSAHDANEPDALSPLSAACLAAWTAAFELMEDEDEETRDVAAAAAARGAGADEDAQTEATLRLSFAVFADRFAGSRAFEDVAAFFVSGGFWGDEPSRGSVEKPLRDALAETKGVRRLFDREADNHHAEGLLLAQLSARAIAEVPGTVTRAFAASSLRDAARAVAAAARTLASDAEATAATTRESAFPGWAGGATNHGSAFAVVNRACLALWAYARPAGAEARRDARAVLEEARVAAAFETARLGPAAAAAWRAAEAAVSDETLSFSDPRGEDAERAERADATTNATRAGDAFRTYDPCFLLR